MTVKWTELWRDRKGTEGARQATAQTLRYKDRAMIERFVAFIDAFQSTCF